MQTVFLVFLSIFIFSAWLLRVGTVSGCSFGDNIIVGVLRGHSYQVERDSCRNRNKIQLLIFSVGLHVNSLQIFLHGKAASHWFPKLEHQIIICSALYFLFVVNASVGMGSTTRMTHEYESYHPQCCLTHRTFFDFEGSTQRSRKARKYSSFCQFYFQAQMAVTFSPR